MTQIGILLDVNVETFYLGLSIYPNPAVSCITPSLGDFVRGEIAKLHCQGGITLHYLTLTTNNTLKMVELRRPLDNANHSMLC